MLSSNIPAAPWKEKPRGLMRSASYKSRNGKRNETKRNETKPETTPYNEHMHCFSLQQHYAKLASFPGSSPVFEAGREPGNEASFAYDDCQYYAYVVNA